MRTSPSRSGKPEPQLALVASSYLCSLLGIKGPTLLALPVTPQPMRGLPMLQCLPVWPGGHGQELCPSTPGRSRRTPRPGPGGAAAPRETMSVKNTAACLGCSLAPETSSWGTRPLKPTRLALGQHVSGDSVPLGDLAPASRVGGGGALTGKGLSAQREVQGVPRQKEKENHQLPVPGLCQSETVTILESSHLCRVGAGATVRTAKMTLQSSLHCAGHNPTRSEYSGTDVIRFILASHINSTGKGRE